MVEKNTSSFIIYVSLFESWCTGTRVEGKPIIIRPYDLQTSENKHAMHRIPALEKKNELTDLDEVLL